MLSDLKKINYKPRIWYLTKLSFKHEREIKPLQNKQKVRVFINITPALLEVLNVVLQVEMKCK